jgi:NADH dehydrogenase
VEDVAEAIARVLEGTNGVSPCYEFAGRRVYTYEELVRRVADQVKVRPRLVPVPFALWYVLAMGAEFLHSAPVTRNQVALMQRDNVASGDYPGLESLRITPTGIEDMLSTM